jgi:hypothetical protein
MDFELGGSRSMSSWTLDNRVSGGRVVRIFVHRRGELVDQWFIVAIDDDEQAKVAIAKLQAYVRVEIIATLSPTVVARWNLLAARPQATRGVMDPRGQSWNGHVPAPHPIAGPFFDETINS